MLSSSLRVIGNGDSSLVIPVLIVLFMLITSVIILDGLSCEAFLVHM